MNNRDGDGSILRGKEYSYALDATDGACLLHRPSSTWETSYSIHPSYITERTEIPGDEPGNNMWMITRLDVRWTYNYRLEVCKFAAVVSFKDWFYIFGEFSGRAFDNFDITISCFDLINIMPILLAVPDYS